MSFSTTLNEKIARARKCFPKTKLGPFELDSPLWLAPMAGISTPNFRLLMQELGAPITVSELVSCHGINHGNQRTLDMLKIDHREKIVGLQLFGDNAESMARAAKVAQDRGPQFIDINMGCPVNKVVNKGGGSALLKETKSLGHFFKTVKSAIDIPLSIKIRTGWDQENLNADEIIRIAYEEGIEWVAIHGRTRTQAYRGKADWDYLQSVKENSPLPIIGNGDLHHKKAVREKLATTNFDGYMLARGPLRSPFLFLEAFSDEEFTSGDYIDVIERLIELTTQHFERERIRLVQIKKLVVWFTAGMPGSAKFRSNCFQAQDLKSLQSIIYPYFTGENFQKEIDYNQDFMMGGHG